MASLPADCRYSQLTAPAVLLFGDDRARRAGLAALVEEIGGRVVAGGPLDGALDRIGSQAVLGGLVLDLERDDGGVLDALLSRIEAAAAGGHFPSLVLVPPALIDVVTARVADRDVALLVSPDDAEVEAALRAMLAPRPMMLADSSAETHRRLAELSAEVGRIARTLASLSNGPDDEEEDVEVLPPEPRPDASDLAMLRTLIRLRSLRGRHFEPALFADPAWDMLLDLAAARLERRRTAVSSLCIAAAVPPTTALRWIGAMTEQGLLVRRPDPDDGRRVFIGLAEPAAGAMTAYVTAARKLMAPVPLG